MKILQSFTSKKSASRQTFEGSNGTGLRIFFIGLFFVALWFPLIDMAFPILPRTENTEKRTLAQAPELRLRTLPDFPKNFERYFNDRFGSRNLLVGLNNTIHVQWFKVSPLKSVLVGKEGWLFYTLDKGINDYRGLAPFSQEHLETIRRNIMKQTSWLREQGIPYLILISPNKHTVYPEYLPGGITRVDRKTRLDQILEYLHQDEKAVFVDVRKKLVEGKRDRLVYSKTDTHWNSYGAFIAYRKTMEALSKDFTYVAPLAISNFEVSVKPSHGLGDLAVMLSLNGRLKDQVVDLKLKDDSWIPKKKMPKAVIFHDSFIFSIKPFLAYHFDQIILQHWGERGFDYRLIEQEKPSVIIFQLAERRLDALLK
jgi:alginate O-acetyltransferase complex protein AlgJ